MFWFCVSQSDYRKSYIQKWISPELISTNSSPIVRLGVADQILAVPDAIRAARDDIIATGEARQDKHRGKRVVSGDFGPLPGTMRELHELGWRQNDVIECGCYDNINHTTHAVATAPERPVVSIGNVTGHETIQVNQFDRSQSASCWSDEPTRLVISRAKTHWRRSCLSPDS